jgi:hypothetical protein
MDQNLLSESGVSAALVVTNKPIGQVFGQRQSVTPRRDLVSSRSSDSDTPQWRSQALRPMP